MKAVYKLHYHYTGEREIIKNWSSIKDIAEKACEAFYPPKYSEFYEAYIASDEAEECVSEIARVIQTYLGEGKEAAKKELSSAKYATKEVISKFLELASEKGITTVELEGYKSAKGRGFAIIEGVTYQIEIDSDRVSLKKSDGLIGLNYTDLEKIKSASVEDFLGEMAEIIGRTHKRAVSLREIFSL